MTIAVSPSHPSNPTSPFYSPRHHFNAPPPPPPPPSPDCEGVNICWWSGLDLGFLSPSYDGGGLFCDSRSLAKGWQVVLTQEMQGMVVAVPEPKAWDTP
ncbi:hypothetical protein Tco_1456283 [Tanacetum coccineum]